MDICESQRFIPRETVGHTGSIDAGVGYRCDCGWRCPLVVGCLLPKGDLRARELTSDREFWYKTTCDLQLQGKFPNCSTSHRISNVFSFLKLFWRKQEKQFSCSTKKKSRLWGTKMSKVSSLGEPGGVHLQNPLESTGGINCTKHVCIIFNWQCSKPRYLSN